jgi:hypothetical protein
MLTVLVTAFTALSQVPKDTTFIITAKRNTIDLYQKALRTQSRLYNGSKYAAPKQTFEQHPYFASEDWITGAVFYDGEYFPDIPLMYDLFLGALVTEHYPSGHFLELVPEKLQYFSMGDHYFEKIENESVSNSLPKTGFYEILYDGKTRLVSLRQKYLREKIEAPDIIITYEEKNRYFIFMDEVFFPVKSKASMLKLLDDRKRELKRFLKQQQIKFSSNRELALKSLAEHYDSLK